MNGMLATAVLGAKEYLAGTAVVLSVVLVCLLLRECWGSMKEAWTKGKLRSALVFVRVALTLLGMWVAGCALFHHTKPQLVALLGAINGAIASALTSADTAGK